MLTHHAKLRFQQRGIRSEVLQTLLAYGRRRYRKGAEVYFMDKSARTRALAELGSSAYAKVADRLNTYIVVASDGGVITAAKRQVRLKF